MVEVLVSVGLLILITTALDLSVFFLNKNTERLFYYRDENEDSKEIESKDTTDSAAKGQMESEVTKASVDKERTREEQAVNTKGRMDERVSDFGQDMAVEDIFFENSSEDTDVMKLANDLVSDVYTMSEVEKMFEG